MARGAIARDLSVRPATHPGLEPAPFEGPLCAFRVDEDSGSPAAVHLGGDLHAVHPGVREPPAPRPRDRTLDSARIALGGAQGETIETIALDGIWCLALPADPGPYFTLTDSEGRIRSWLILAPPRQMIGIAHHWLPRVPLRKDPAGCRRGPISPPSDGSEMAESSLQIRKIRRCHFSRSVYLNDGNQKIFRYPKGAISPDLPS
jgi:hypothetical protein